MATKLTTEYLSLTNGFKTGQRSVTISGGMLSQLSSLRMMPC